MEAYSGRGSSREGARIWRPIMEGVHRGREGARIWRPIVGGVYRGRGGARIWRPIVGGVDHIGGGGCIPSSALRGYVWPKALCPLFPIGLHRPLYISNSQQYSCTLMSIVLRFIIAAVYVISRCTTEDRSCHAVGWSENILSGGRHLI